jgi:ABC-type multidrug transport system permease subunit
VLIVIIILLSRWHFGVTFHDLPALALVCLLFLLCSLGLGLLISAFSRTQTQAIQFSVFFLLPVFVLSGAFAPLEQLPQAVRYISELFPLTHFCRAFRLVNMYHAGLHFYVGDLVILLAGAVITFLGAAFLLRRIEKCGQGNDEARITNERQDAWTTETSAVLFSLDRACSVDFYWPGNGRRGRSWAFDAAAGF